MMKETALLTAINHIYNHYSGSYGTADETGILAAVAAGHRRWAIRGSFSSIDSVFDPERESQVEREMSQLAELLMTPKPEKEYLQRVALRTSYLLVEKRAHESFRRKLWPIYEILRDDPRALCIAPDIPFSAFVYSAQEAVGEWESLRKARTMITNDEQGAGLNDRSASAPRS